MERPDLRRMLKAIERRQVNLVITKELSRLGRNYLQTGTLIEDFFLRNGVCYIAMNDGIDTMRDIRTKWEKKDPENGQFMWDFSVIKELLMNPVYIGAIASQKWSGSEADPPPAGEALKNSIDIF